LPARIATPASDASHSDAGWRSVAGGQADWALTKELDFSQ